MGKRTIVNQKGKSKIFSNEHLKPSLLSYFCIFLGLGWFISVPLILTTLPLLYYYSTLSFSILLGSILLSALYSSKPEYQPAWCWKIGKFIMSNVEEYYQFKLIFENFDAVNECSPAIFLCEPHGVLPISLFWGGLGYQKFEMKCGMSSAMFAMPLMKHFLTWAGAIDVSRESLRRFLKRKVSVNVCAGGVQEVLHWMSKKECVLYLKSRGSLTRLALQEGVPLVPSFTFGLRGTYEILLIKNEFLVAIGRKFGFAPAIFTGLWGVPFAQSKPCPVVVVVGEPIPVPRIENPTPADIDKYHSQLLEQMQLLYDRHKASNGMADVPLKII